MVLGTAGYMSPEQVRGNPADQRSDIFSFGAVLYEMLSGTRPFRGETTAELMSAILRDDPPELARRDTPPALVGVVRRCLEKRPEERFQSARDVAFALEAMSGARAGIGFSSSRQSRRPLLVGAAAVLGVVSLAALAAWLRACPSRAPGHALHPDHRRPRGEGRPGDRRRSCLLQRVAARGQVRPRPGRRPRRRRGADRDPVSGCAGRRRIPGRRGAARRGLAGAASAGLAARGMDGTRPGGRPSPGRRHPCHRRGMVTGRTKHRLHGGSADL